MRDLKIALLQFNQIWENKQANFAEIKKVLSDKKDFDLLLLPEMFHTGFSMNHQEMAEEMHNSEGIEFLKEISKTYKAAIYTSLIIKSKEGVYNRGVFIRENQLEIYDKRKCFSLGGEADTYQAGTKAMISTLLGWRLNLQICYDLRFPELIRNEIDYGGVPKYDALLYVANWPKKRIQHWIKLLQARAIENQCYVIACNRVGADNNNLEYNGKSLIIDANGDILSQESNDCMGELILGTLSFNSLKKLRAELPFLEDR